MPLPNEKTKERDFAIITLLLGTGIRVSECVGLDIEDVNGKTMELNLDNYRKKTACLIQNFVHFQMTLRENLAPNDFSELSEDPLIDFANNFPDRLNTFLGALDSNGVELSGGQWKRIALYRTLHKKDVDLIVLDEPTANLDPKISENIINRLLKPNYNKTVIVITHDFELAKKFDRIIGMKEGKIICDRIRSQKI